jgi:hypothetical protein
MPVLSYRITERPLASFWASKDSQFATAVIVEPLNPPLAGIFVVLENVRWLSVGLAHSSPYQGAPRVWALIADRCP